MSRVFLGLGSNWQAPRHVGLALDALSDRYGKLDLSSVYQSEAVGFAGDDFLNLVVGLAADDSVAALSNWLKNLEARHGRRRDRPGPGHLPLDVDILTYGALVGEFAGVQLPRAEILQNAFVLQPLAEIAGDELHPIRQRPYRELWQAHPKQQNLWKVPFTWRGKVISPRERSSSDI